MTDTLSGALPVSLLGRAWHKVGTTGSGGGTNKEVVLLLLLLLLLLTLPPPGMQCCAVRETREEDAICHF